eukprot:TRINITY_DN8453_c0_g1_i1.p1 TRINITY_DN8453_c0_g1~~TRINITY_DN8453_c0_g1_i1.p1  ORF type:complete len:151 (+),score=38.39 TRINITY_DN8453_c0_g1_i1:106-558(+)
MDASADLLWLLVKKQNKFLVKRNGNSSASVQFSGEPNNLYNFNSFKFSGLANRKTVEISAAGEGLNVVLSTTKRQKTRNPSALKHSSTLKRDFRTMAKVVVNQVVANRYRPDLKRAALARLSAVHKALRVAKAGSGSKASKSSKKALARK